ncbi:hypothetical protein GTR04_0951 [Trichophyton interdigitale]|nr:hypothetical protein GY631_5306 [Trichophyton interdigitale]KAG5218703.1 hypothetical protein GY632_5291 [Trichophyton interdigitale]KAG8211629.1 hypothetical protein GTR04_0951 [Trichophyton interdigitale]
MSRFIKSYSVIPKELFRINNGRVPKALNPATYQRKNTNRPCAIDINTSIRLIHACFDEISTKWSFNAAKYSKDAADCSRPQGELGIGIPDDLILVHEFKDHYSLQARNAMTIEDLNAKITRFLEGSGRCLSKDEWLREYPEATETE